VFLAFWHRVLTIWYQDSNSNSDDERNIFAHLSRFMPLRNTVAVQDELTTFLNGRPEQLKDGNAILWWQQNQSTFPRLALMAFDYLCIPGVFRSVCSRDCF